MKSFRSVSFDVQPGNCSQLQWSVLLQSDCRGHTTGSELTFFGFLHWDSILFIFSRGGGCRGGGFGSTALLPQASGHIINVVRVFRRTVVFDMIHTNGATFNLKTAQFSHSINCWDSTSSLFIMTGHTGCFPRGQVTSVKKHHGSYM